MNGSKMAYLLRNGRTFDREMVMPNLMRCLVILLVGAALAMPAAADILWSGDFETGDRSQWIQGNPAGGGYFNSGNWTTNIVNSPTHSGNFSDQLIIRPNNGGSSGIRPFRWAESRTGADLYYSGWFYVPQQYSFSWWALMQFKAVSTINGRNDPAWVILVNRSGAGGAMRFYVANHWDGQFFSENPDTFQQMINPTDVPIGRWFHMEAFLHQATPSQTQMGSGSILQIWIDGVMIFDLGPGHADNVNYPSLYEDSGTRGQEWSLLNYGVVNQETTIWIDDAAISTTRIGAGEPPPPPPPPPGAQIEAESGTLVAPMTTVADATASGGRYVATNTANSGTATYSLNVPTTGDYTIVGRVYGANNGTDSFHYKIDNQAEEVWHLNPSQSAALYGVWREVAITRVGTGTPAQPQFDPYIVNLTAGTHTLVFRGREAGARLDWIKLVAQQQPPPPPQDTEPPTTPQNVMARTLSSSSIEVTWAASTDNVGVTGYEIWRDGVARQQVSGTTLSFTDNGLQPITTYSYQVRARDAAGNWSGLSAAAESVTNPVAPSDTTPPVVQITSPGAGAIVPRNTRVDVIFSITEPESAVTATLSVNNEDICAVTGPGTHTCMWKVPPQKGVSHVLVLRATSGGGNSSDMISVRTQS